MSPVRAEAASTLASSAASPAAQLARSRARAPLPAQLHELHTVAANRAGAPPSVHEVLSSPGRALDAATRAFFEPRLGRDLGHVRVHTDDRAARSADDVGASAYAVGPRIVFGAGRWAPEGAAGRQLLAHELAHVLAETGTPTLRRQEAGPTTTPTTAPAQAAGTTPGGDEACRQGITNTVLDAAVWLWDAINQLVTWEAYEEFPAPAKSAAEADHARVTRTLERVFHTADRWYATLIHRRLFHALRTLGSPELTIACPVPNDASCAGLGAYVPRPYEIRFCGAMQADSRRPADLIHELMHAVIPQVGVTARLTEPGAGLRDRAYEGNRLFRTMTPDEALDNAASYEVLVRELVARRDVDVAPGPVDRPVDCASPQPILSAMARIELWTRDAASFCKELASALAPREEGQPETPLADVHPSNRRALERHFPNVTTRAGVLALQQFYSTMKLDSAMQTGLTVTCAGPEGPCSAATVLAFGPEGSVTDSGVTLKRLAASGSNLCPRWFDADEATRTLSLFALYVIRRDKARNMGINLANVFRYVAFARDASATRTPAPPAVSIGRHLEDPGREQGDTITPLLSL